MPQQRAARSGAGRAHAPAKEAIVMGSGAGTQEHEKRQRQKRKAADGQGHAVYAPKEEEAVRKLNTLIADLTKGQVVAPTKLRVGDAIDEWLRDCEIRSLRPKTMASYRQVARLYLKPEVGRIKLRELRPEHVRRLVAALVERGLSAATVR